MVDLMTHKNKRSGADFERRMVRKARAAGLGTVRAYGSDGRSLGLSAEVDIMIDDWRIQCKHRRQVASYIKPSAKVDAQIVGDRSGQYVVMTWAKFLEVVKLLKLDRHLATARDLDDTYHGFLGS
jgi:hypothetical protein